MSTSRDRVIRYNEEVAISESGDVHLIDENIKHISPLSCGGSIRIFGWSTHELHS